MVVSPPVQVAQDFVTAIIPQMQGSLEKTHKQGYNSVHSSKLFLLLEIKIGKKILARFHVKAAAWFCLTCKRDADIYLAPVKERFML